MKSSDQEQLCSSLPHSVYYADWVRREERTVAQAQGIQLADLMERAGSEVYQLGTREYPQARHWLILCGNGNNGGDGYVVARLARQAGIRVTLVACQGQGTLPEEAQQARKRWLQAGGKITHVETPWPVSVDLIIDALLGIGLAAAPREPYSELITMANAHPAPVVAVDIPSGLLADSGWVPGEAICAAHTQVLVALKPGLLTGQARNRVGTLHYADLGLQQWLQGQHPAIQRLDEENLTEWFTSRDPCAHKGDFGRLLLIGGDLGYGGAIGMAGAAALRSGAGLVRVLTHSQHVAALLALRPELMVQALDDEVLTEALSWADTLVIGPGLGQRQWGRQIVQRVRECHQPAVWDADALNLLASDPDKRQNRVLTPHPGEAARLLGCSVADIESDRLLAAQRLLQQYGGCIILKGAGTIIASDDGLAIADVGNPGMATGGMGDILSGILGGLLAQGAAQRTAQKMTLFTTVCAGCVVHGAAADSVAARQGQRGMLATDLLAVIPEKINSDQRTKNENAICCNGSAG